MAGKQVLLLTEARQEAETSRSFQTNDQIEMNRIFLTVALLLANFGGSATACSYYSDTNGTSRLDCSELKDRDTANTYCESRGYHLAAIQTSYDYLLLNTLLNFIAVIGNKKLEHLNRFLSLGMKGYQFFAFLAIQYG